MTAQNNTLHCYAKGDKRFSAYGAKVTIGSVTDTIEFWYQLAKNFTELPNKPKQTSSWDEKMQYTRDVKSLQKQKIKPVSIQVTGKTVDATYLTAYYKLLWLSYLDNHPDLVTYASGFDSFLDIYGKNAVNNQADVIEQYVKQGRDSLLLDVKPLVLALKQ